MFIIDAHQDIAYACLTQQRDYREAVAVTRAREGAHQAEIATLGLPDALAGGVGVVFGTLFVLPHNAHSSMDKAHAYHSPEEAHNHAHAQLALYRQLDQAGALRLIETQADLATVCRSWADGTPCQGLVVLMENADAIRMPEEAAAWHAAGVRIVGPAWQATRYCGGTGAPGPLTDDGRALLRAMAQARLALDISHMAEESFWQALDLFDGPLLASHANCRALVPGPRADRHLSDAMITALVERDAVIGVVLYNRFLDSAWTLAAGKQAVTLADVVRHIDHICQLASDARHVGIGSDLDGGFGCEATPREIDSVADLPRIAEALQRAGYRDADIAAIMGNNWLRVLARVLPG